MSTDNSSLEYWETDEWQWFHVSRQVISEADWLTCPTPDALLDYVNRTDLASRRKFFLAGSACVRRVWHLLDQPESRTAVEAAEQYAEGHINEEELRAIHPPAATAYGFWPEDDPRFWAGLAASRLNHGPRGNHGNAEHTMYAVGDVPKAIASMTGTPENVDAWNAARQGEMRVLADLYPCVMGNPFRPTHTSPEWLTHTVVQLARGIYTDRAFDRLPILADALQEAGCEDDQLLGHCRASGLHARGCWPIDLLLGKE